MKTNTRKNLKCIILIGPPASGKSFWAKEFLSKNTNYIRVNRDSFRFMLRDLPFCQPKIEAMITELQEYTIKKALSKRLNVIVDNTNLKEKYITPIVKLVEAKADVEYMLFDISLEKALERDKNREKSVGEKILTKMYKDFEIFKDTFHFQNKPKLKREVIASEFLNSKVKHNPELYDCIVCDIDGTLTIMNRHPFAWDKVDLDYPNPIVIEHLRMHNELGRKIILMSGRDCESRELTEKWLKDNNVMYDELYMRGELSGGPNQDFRKDNIIKEELYDKYIKDKYNVLVVYDDRNDMIKLWRDLGLECFQINYSPD